MKAVIQRVKQARVKVANSIKGEIKVGYLVYICFEENDTKEILQKVVDKIINLRIFEDEQEKMNYNIKDVKGEILSVSQFTLCWDGKKGHRPSFDKSMAPNNAKIFYKLFNDLLKESEVKVEMGVFGANMEVESVNDGPVTFFLDY